MTLAGGAPAVWWVAPPNCAHLKDTSDPRGAVKLASGAPEVWWVGPLNCAQLKAIFYHNAHDRIANRKQSNIFSFQSRNAQHDYFEEINRVQ